MASLDNVTLQELKDIANKLRIYSIKATNASKSGHEQGHAAPILYAAWAETGLFPIEDLLNLRKIDSDLEGHPTPRLPFVDVATGSLGQGLSCAAGMAYTGKHFDKSNYRVYCVIGDGESAEGSIWEALAFAGHYKLDNLVAIFDINRLGQSEPTALQHQMDVYKARLEAFNFNTVVVDGHDISALCSVFDAAAKVKGKPTAVIAKTYKGHGLPGIEDQENWHGKPIGDKADGQINGLLKLITNNGRPKIGPKPPSDDASVTDNSIITLSSPPSYTIGEKVATRLAYGTAIAKLGNSSSKVIAMDGDTKNSTFSDKFKKAHPERFIECYIAEQNMVGIGIGCSTRNRTIPFISTFAAFFTRAFDQLRMGSISQANIKCAGSHAGISIGEDGPSQMALEDLAMFRSLPTSTVFYPCDAVSTERACELAANTRGICFIRTSRPATAVLYNNDENFQVGEAKIVRKSNNDQVLVIGAGVTLHEALKAADELSQEGINIRVMDPFTLKPIDEAAIIKNATEVGGRIVTVEDHYPEGGLGEAVASAVSMQRNIIVKRLAVRKLPRSGPPNVLLDMFGISSNSIKEGVKEILNQ
ncbi:transketolase-like protein 2 [Centruroides sculpturatus]|uniref:transketolase-like protein 2 n=1 Tax=Centruroides sculpturatus TaxID=218467 RepID=UPI000C6CB049|nr:transketolase-like protein 2 [Centruroides sculpturatus]